MHNGFNGTLCSLNLKDHMRMLSLEKKRETYHIDLNKAVSLHYPPKIHYTWLAEAIFVAELSNVCHRFPLTTNGSLSHT